MHKSKLIKLLKGFNSDDWKVCKKFITLYADKENEPAQLYSFISKYKLKLNHKYLSIDNISKTVLSGKSRKGVQNVMSKLVLIIEEYYRWDWLNENKIEKDLILLQALDSRSLYKLADQKIQHLQSDIEESKTKDVQTNISRFKLYHFWIDSENPSRIKVIKSIFSNLTTSLEILIKNAALFYQVGYPSYTTMSNDKDKSIWLRLEKLTENGHSDEITPILELLKKLQIKYNQEEFDLLKAGMLKDDIELSLSLKQTILSILIQIIGKRITSTGNIPIEDLLNLYEYGLETSLLLVDKHINPIKFNNIVGIAVKSGEFKWAENFISNYKNLVELKYRQETEQVSQAIILFNQNKYDSVIDLLGQTKTTSIILTLPIRWMLLCSHFMAYRNEPEFLHSAFRNFHNFLNNNKRKISHKNFVGSTNLMTILESQVKYPSRKNLLEELNTDRFIIYRTWLNKLCDNKNSPESLSKSGELFKLF